ncbi:uridine kinase family protein [Mycolicibacterium sediminis]|uniref:Uridine kinase n=1 Tax=Mycolicibacterium sediminis TaxID=1286180 RepID=A0A7I7QMI7_9MYCO|nr:hypothetical protein [Mycolicibacterium sediminis]BBY27494.1 hypothetical protein MSEDJ_15900 [Mycolicibacterium sediminis]
MNSGDEPTFTEWAETTYAEVLTRLRSDRRHGGIVLIGVDGRSGSGKSTFAANLARAAAHVAVIHTDDIAWHHSFFDWHDHLVDGVLSRLRRAGPPVAFRPPAWDVRHRPGSVEVPADTEVLVVEGVGACREQLHSWFDATVWIQSDADLAYRRVLARGDDSVEFVDDWTAREIPFLANDRPWARATVVVSGQSSLGDGRLLIAEGPPCTAERDGHHAWR